MSNEGMNAFQTRRTQLEALASLIPEQGFSFQGDGHSLSIMALLLLDECQSIINDDEKITYLGHQFLVFADAFDWNLTDNQKSMIKAFAGLAVRFPQFLGR